MFEGKRSIEDLISIYTLEPTLVDFYVEGITDKIVYENYINSRLINIKVIEIDTIEITKKYDLDNGLDLKSNKDSLVFLSRLLSTFNITATVLCIVDKDLDEALEKLEVNAHLKYSDYNCLESYFFCNIIMNKLINVGIRNFPYSVDKILLEVGKVLRGLFIIRIIRHNFSRKDSLLRIENNIVIDKTTGTISFDAISYLNKFIQANKLTMYKQQILSAYSEYDKKLSKDVKDNLNGHDFIEVLYLYINKIKNTPNFKMDNFERAIYLCIQPDYFDKYGLFTYMRKFSKDV